MLSNRENKDLQNLPSTFMLCYLNGFDDAKQKLIDAKPLLKTLENKTAYNNFKEVMRVLRKVKYGNNEQ